MRIGMRHSMGHSMGHSMPHGMRNGVRKGIPMACAIMACAKACAMVCEMVWYSCAHTPRMCLGDAPARTFAKTHYSGPGRSLALVVVARGRYRQWRRS